MSMFDDFKADYAYEMDNHSDPSGDVWTTRNNVQIKICDMTDAHIRNCMKMVGKGCEWYERFEAELEKRQRDKSAKEITTSEIIRALRLCADTKAHCTECPFRKSWNECDEILKRTAAEMLTAAEEKERKYKREITSLNRKLGTSQRRETYLEEKLVTANNTIKNYMECFGIDS